jgi:Sulfotransferase family
LSVTDRIRDLMGGGGRGVPPAPFICGVNRSGTTLLRLMLDAHPQMAIPPETHFVPELIKELPDDPTVDRAIAVITAQREWADFGFSEEELRERFAALPEVTPRTVTRDFFAAYGERFGKPRWGDKTPKYVRSMRRIQRTIPEARFVHVIRDGRDIALSRWDQRSRRGLEGPPVERIAAQWDKKIRSARADAPKLRHYVEVRYEDLIADTEATLRRVCEFVELDFDPAMLSYHERASERLAEMAHELPARGSRPEQAADHRLNIHALTTEPPRADRIARWKRKMSDADIAGFEREAGELLGELGYELAAGAHQETAR